VTLQMIERRSLYGNILVLKSQLPGAYFIQSFMCRRNSKGESIATAFSKRLLYRQCQKEAEDFHIQGEIHSWLFVLRRGFSIFLLASQPTHMVIWPDTNRVSSTALVLPHQYTQGHHVALARIDLFLISTSRAGMLSHRTRE